MTEFWEGLALGDCPGMKLDTFSGLLRMNEGPAAEADLVAGLDSGASTHLVGTRPLLPPFACCRDGFGERRDFSYDDVGPGRQISPGKTRGAIAKSGR